MSTTLTVFCSLPLIQVLRALSHACITLPTVKLVAAAADLGATQCRDRCQEGPPFLAKAHNRLCSMSEPVLAPDSQLKSSLGVHNLLQSTPFRPVSDANMRESTLGIEMLGVYAVGTCLHPLWICVAFSLYFLCLKHLAGANFLPNTFISLNTS